MRRYTPDEESLKIQGSIPDLRRWIPVVLVTNFSFVFPILGLFWITHMSMVFFFVADRVGQNEAIVFAEI